MNENQIEKNYIEKCKKMTFQELENYIKDCFEKLKSSEILTERVPIKKETYESLMNLLETNFNENFLIQAKVNKFSKSLENFILLKNSLYRESVEQNIFNEITANKIRNKIDSNIKILATNIEDLLKILCSEVVLASNILNCSAKLNEKLNVVFSLQDTEIQDVNEKFNFFEYLPIIASLSKLKKSIDEISQERKHRESHLKANITRLSGSLRFNKFELEDHYKEIKPLRNGEISELYGKPSTKHREELIRILETRIKNRERRQDKLIKSIKQQEELLQQALSENNSRVLLGKYNENIEELSFLLNKTINQINLEIVKIQEIDKTNVNQIESRKLVELLQNSIDNLRNEKEQLFKNYYQNLEIRKLPWEVMPEGEWTAESIIKIFKSYTYNHKEFDEQRLSKITDYLILLCQIKT